MRNRTERARCPSHRSRINRNKVWLRCRRLWGLHSNHRRQAKCSCLTLIGQVDEGTLKPLKASQRRKIASPSAVLCGKPCLQCGYCTPGMLMSAKAFLGRAPSPSEEEIRVAISGNLCRCKGTSRSWQPSKRLQTRSRRRKIGSTLTLTLTLTLT